jgi:hypothetical protein
MSVASFGITFFIITEPLPTVASAKFSYDLAPVASDRPSPDLACVLDQLNAPLRTGGGDDIPEMERSRNHAVTRRDDLDEVSACNFHSRHFVGWQTHQVCKLHAATASA